jgi:hypothetical protein
VENEVINIVIPMRKDDLLEAQRAAVIQGKLMPDFVTDAIRAVTRDSMAMGHEKRHNEDLRCELAGRADGKADAIQKAYSLLRDHGHNEAADLLGKSFTTIGNPVAVERA